MRPAAVALTLALLSPPPARAQIAPAPRTPIFAAQVESVLIDAFVSGQPPHLSAKDFVLRDNGAIVPFDLLPNDSLPIRALLVFDASSSMKGVKLDRLRSAARALLEQLRPQDETALIAFADEVTWLTPFTSDRSRVRDGLLSLQAEGKATAVHDALFTALVMPRSAMRTLVILFSDGEDNTSWLRESQVKRAVERSNALVHVVAAGPENQGAASVRTPIQAAHVRSLRGLAEITGGSLIEVDRTGNIEAAFTEIMTAMRGRYVLRYSPDTDPAPGWHTLDLRLRSGKGKVRGRTGYWVEER